MNDPENFAEERNVRDEFLRIYARDLECDELRSLGEYQALFPGFETGIAEEFAQLDEGDPAPPVEGGPSTITRTDSESPDGDDPTQIGPYRVLEMLGEGGMGTVYLAEQRKPVRRRVAVKVIKLGMDSKQVLARFEVERQALAMMSHDNIARVFEVGTTRRGQPYFVMEHVEGIPITDYCDRHKLSIQERIELFQQVCAGVQHAHQKGIIHRDIKPTNVLVTRRDDRAIPKIIDFGLARATNHQLIEQTFFTEQGQIVGTPEYMSPEQAEFDAQGIDTRTDIYSLGVMLYEILAGELPFSPNELRAAGMAEIQRKIREDQPQRPSTRVATRDDATSDRADRRQTSLHALTRQLRGDLDWIVLKAMAKEPERRYASAGDLTQDLDRHLHHEPVLAGPPSAVYRLGKMVRKHRAQFLACALVFLTAIIGALVSWGYAVEARAKEREAKQHAAEARRSARGMTSLHEFLVDEMIASVTAERARGRKLTVEDVFANAAQRVDKELGSKPEIAALVRLSLGDAFWKIGRLDEALANLRSAFSALDASNGRGHRDTLVAAHRLGWVHLDRNELEAAAPLLRDNFAIRRSDLGPEDPLTLSSEHALADLHLRLGELDQAEQAFRRIWRARSRVLGASDKLTLSSLRSYAIAIARQRRPEEAEPLMRQFLETADEHLGRDDPSTAAGVHELACILEDGGKLAEAEKLFRRCLEDTERLVGRDHPDFAATLNSLAILLQNQNKLQEAEQMFRQSLATRRRVHHDQHPRLARGLLNLASFLNTHGKPTDLPEAVRNARQGLLIFEQAEGVQDRSTTESRIVLAELLHRSSETAAAEAEFRKAIAAGPVAFKDSSWSRGQLHRRFGRMLRETGRPAAAVTQFEIAFQAMRESMELTDQDVQSVVRSLVELLEQQPDGSAESRAWRDKLK